MLQVRTEGLDKCYTNEEAAEATCPDEKTAQFKDIILYSKLPPSLHGSVLSRWICKFWNFSSEKLTFLFDDNNLRTAVHCKFCLVLDYKHAYKFLFLLFLFVYTRRPVIVRCWKSRPAAILSKIMQLRCNV